MSSYIPLYFYSFFITIMKLSKKDISLLADAILKSIWDERARAQKLEAETEKELREMEDKIDLILNQYNNASV